MASRTLGKPALLWPENDAAGVSGTALQQLQQQLGSNAGQRGTIYNWPRSSGTQAQISPSGSALKQRLRIAATPCNTPDGTAQGSQGPVWAASGPRGAGQAALSDSTETAPPWRHGRTQRAPPLQRLKNPTKIFP